MFRWICLILAAVTVLCLLWIIVDLKRQIDRTAQTVNESLPAILEKTRRSTETLAALADDIRQLRDLAGVADKARDQTLIAYADSVLDFIAASGGRIGLDKKLLGSGLKSVASADEWVTDARKEALWLALRARSRAELVTRLCENKFGSAWYIQIGDTEPIPLLEWLRRHHAETQKLALEERRS